MKKIILAAAALAVVSLGYSCGVASDKVTNSVGMQGANLEGPKGSAIEIPGGAVSSNVSVTAETAATPAAPPEATTVGATIVFGPEGQKFTVPVTITLEVDLTKLPSGATADNIVILTAPANSDVWEELGGTVIGNKVRASTTHFSKFVPAVRKPKDGSTTPPQKVCSYPVACSGGDIPSAGNQGGGSSTLVCAATVGEVRYVVNCKGTSCTCSKGGVIGATVNVTSMTTANLDGFRACGYPCPPAPPPPSIVKDGGSDPISSGNRDGGITSPPIDGAGGGAGAGGSSGQGGGGGSGGNTRPDGGVVDGSPDDGGPKPVDAGVMCQFSGVGSPEGCGLYATCGADSYAATCTTLDAGTGLNCSCSKNQVIYKTGTKETNSCNDQQAMIVFARAFCSF